MSGADHPSTLNFLPETHIVVLPANRLAKSYEDVWDQLRARYAEALGQAQMAKNKRKGRRGARSQRDMGPLVEAVLKKLTGEVFEKEKDARDWMKANDKVVKDAIQKLDDIAKQQVEAAKAR